MKCPCCPDTALLISERQGIEIDYCPQCRGVWLDRGELDKLIERASQVTPGQTAARPAAPPQGYTPAGLSTSARTGLLSQEAQAIVMVERAV